MPSLFITKESRGIDEKDYDLIVVGADPVGRMVTSACAGIIKSIWWYWLPGC